MRGLWNTGWVWLSKDRQFYSYAYDVKGGDNQCFAVSSPVPQLHTHPKQLSVLPHWAPRLVYGPAGIRAHGKSLCGLCSLLTAVPEPYPEKHTRSYLVLQNLSQTPAWCLTKIKTVRLRLKIKTVVTIGNTEAGLLLFLEFGSLSRSGSNV